MNAWVPALNEVAEQWWAYVAHATWQGSLLAAVVLAAVRLGRRWPAQLRYGLLLIALVKFAVPPTFSVPTGLFSRLGPAVPAPAVAAEPMSQAAAGAGSLWAALGQVDWRAWLMLAHGLGAAVAAGCVVGEVRRIRRTVRSATPVRRGRLRARLDALSRRVGIRRHVRLYISRRAVSPMAFGAVRPGVLLPAGLFQRAGREQIDTILFHELAHHRRGDIWVNWFEALLAVAWWFNPAFHLLGRAARSAREDCCDDLLLARRLTTDGTYCQALLNVARALSRRVLAGATAGFVQRFHPLGDRMRRIMDRSLRRVPGLSYAAVAVTIVFAVLALPGLRTDGPAPPVGVDIAEAPASADPHEPLPDEPAGFIGEIAPPMLASQQAPPHGPHPDTVLVPDADGPHAKGPAPFGLQSVDPDPPDGLADGRLSELSDPIAPARALPSRHPTQRPARPRRALDVAVCDLLPVHVPLPGGVVRIEQLLDGLTAPARARGGAGEPPAAPTGPGRAEVADAVAPPEALPAPYERDAPAAEPARHIRLTEPAEPLEHLAFAPPEADALTGEPALADPFAPAAPAGLDSLEPVLAAAPSHPADPSDDSSAAHPAEPTGEPLDFDPFFGGGLPDFALDWGDFAPEPTAGLLLSALAAVALLRRRRGWRSAARTWATGWPATS